MNRAFLRRPGHAAFLLALGAASLAQAMHPGSASAAQENVATEVKRIRAEIETLLATAARDLKRGPEAEKEAADEREKTTALEKEVAAAKTEAEAAEAALQELENAAKTAESELGLEKQKGAALGGYKKLAMDKLAQSPAGSPGERGKLVATLALSERPILEAALARILAEPGAQAATAFEALLKNAATPLPQAEFEKLGSDTRARPKLSAKPDAAAQLDALALAINEAAACAGVDPSELPGRVARVVSGPNGRRAAAAQAGRELASRLRARREVLLREASTALPTLQAALGSAKLARAAARLAVLRGLREVVRDAAKAALGVHVVPIVGEVADADFPRKAAAALFGRIAKHRGGACRPSEAR